MIDFSKIKLLIVDMDNTLCDTFHTLSVPQWERVERKLRERGLDVSVRKLKENFGKHSFRDTLQASGMGQEMINFAIAEYDKVDVSSLQLFDDADELLEIDVPKVLLSRGEPSLQKKKIEHLDIREYFEEVIIVETFETKLDALKRVAEKYGHKPDEYLVIGDRLLEEIKDGNELGMPTVLVLRPDWPVPGSDVKPTMTIDSLEEIAKQFS